MTTIDTSKDKQNQEIEESGQEPVLEDLPETDDHLKEVIREAAVQSRPGTVRETIMPKIRELEALKDGVYAVDLEKIVSDMFAVMKNMEAQLERVLRINSILEKDLNEAKEMIAGLKEAKSQLEQAVSRMEMEAPSKREFQIEIDQLVAERNDAQAGIHEMNSKIGKLKEAVVEYQKRSGDLEEEKRDFMSEISFLESRLNAAVEKIAECREEINVLKGEKLAHAERIKVLEEELNDALDDKYKLMSEFKKSQKAVGELHAALSDKKLQAKKSFYKSTGEREEAT
ncbi:MAG: hypothetical protein HWN68_04500 [Desulfobacterales bacterium]|nr:hypothetical protein [Desulfobacterales bacterium]